MHEGDEITLEPDPVWTDRYEEERKRILNVSGKQLLGVFHVGSTAIPDLPGKPALDIISVFADYESMRATADALTEEDYKLEYDSQDSALVIQWGDHGAVFIKMHIQDDEKVRNQLLFREYLRETPEARRKYERVKRKAAAEHPHDQRAYTEAKADVVHSILEQARTRGYAERLPKYV
ncbi:GrpB family protein [Haladaptatus cibarius]|uniref:GrpB family protein n=1 Tax=Haladaptatus cibarius TaxID=453847 RepID=UPI0006793CBF|nr:GrpB family protein [Haladaptatus cibarius]